MSSVTERVWHLAPQPVMRIVVAVERADRREEVIGGAAAEYYRAGRCVLVTYLYVADSGSHRHRGHARALVATARMAGEALGPVHALLAEVEWPDLLPSHAFSADEVGRARARLRFFARIGARMLNIDYVQPALGPGKQPVSHLRLLVLPSATPGSAHDTDDGRRVAVDGFLTEFYAALAQGSGYPADDARLRQLRQQTAEARPLTTPLP